MSIWQSIKESVTEALNAPTPSSFWVQQVGDAVVEHVEAVTDQKDADYSNYEALTVPMLGVKWTDRASYASKSQALMANSIAKACINMRANGVANIELNKKCNADMLALLDRPNFREPTLQTALKVWETHLSIGGDLYWFWDLGVPGLPQLHTFRQDCVNNNVKLQRYEYDPSGQFKGQSNPDFLFYYDHTGKTVRCQKRVGNSYTDYKGALQHVCYFDPRTSLEGAGAGDSALRAVDIMSSVDDLVLRKFKSGGVKNGFLSLPGLPTDAEREAIMKQLGALNPNGQLGILPGGMEFNSAQLTFQEMSVDTIRDKAAKEICTAFAVPAELVNESVATYANVRGKDKTFYRNFIDPEAKFIVGQLEAGARTYVDPTAQISVDETSIKHLEEDRLDAAKSMAQMNSYTRNEIRASMGYDPLKTGGDEIVGATPNMGQPAEKPKGPVAFNADAGNRGDNNNA